jgi:hypothetical protein
VVHALILKGKGDVNAISDATPLMMIAVVGGVIGARVVAIMPGAGICVRAAARVVIVVTRGCVGRGRRGSRGCRLLASH